MTSAIVSVEQRGTAPVVHVRGEIDVADAVRAEILAAISPGGRGLIVDLTQTCYLDSIGVRLLFDVGEQLHARRQHLVLIVAEEGMIRRVAALTKLDNLAPLVATVDEALHALHNV